jgi:hypothetical protein
MSIHGAVTSLVVVIGFFSVLAPLSAAEPHVTDSRHAYFGFGVLKKVSASE